MWGQVMRLVRIAAGKVPEAMAQLKAALEAHTTAQLAARVRRQRPAAAAAAAFIDVPVQAGKHPACTAPVNVCMRGMYMVRL